MQQLYLVAVQRKRYGDKVRSGMFHLVNLLPGAIGGVPDRNHEGGFVQLLNNLSVDMGMLIMT